MFKWNTYNDIGNLPSIHPSMAERRSNPRARRPQWDGSVHEVNPPTDGANAPSVDGIDSQDT